MDHGNEKNRVRRHGRSCCFVEVDWKLRKIYQHESLWNIIVIGVVFVRLPNRTGS